MILGLYYTRYSERNIEQIDNYHYIDINGVMAANQRIAIDNENAEHDDGADHYWYYFQSNGKASKTVNGTKYTFAEEGKMLGSEK